LGGDIKMKFLILSYSKGKENGINKKILIKLLDESCKLAPKADFIVLGGDNIAGSSIDNILANQLQL
jgi:3',5'-cyclic-AMP phosphodiesterase